MLWILVLSIRDLIFPCYCRVRAGLIITRLWVQRNSIIFLVKEKTIWLTEQKTDPAHVAQQAVTGLLNGDPEIIADELSRKVKAGLSTANTA